MIFSWVACSRSWTRSYSPVRWPLLNTSTRSQMPSSSGISEEQIGYVSLSALYLQAKAAGAVCRIRKKQVLGYSDLGIYRLLFGVKDRRILEQFMESVLGALIQYDARNHTDYLDVLRRYLLTECSIQQTAEQMQVHRNTINYKLRQIREILQTDLNQEARVKIYLAYLIRDML